MFQITGYSGGSSKSMIVFFLFFSTFAYFWCTYMLFPNSVESHISTMKGAQQRKFLQEFEKKEEWRRNEWLMSFLIFSVTCIFHIFIQCLIEYSGFFYVTQKIFPPIIALATLMGLMGVFFLIYRCAYCNKGVRCLHIMLFLLPLFVIGLIIRHVLIQQCCQGVESDPMLWMLLCLSCAIYASHWLKCRRLYVINKIRQENLKFILERQKEFVDWY